MASTVPPAGQWPVSPKMTGTGLVGDGALRTPQLDEQRGDAVAIQLQQAAHVEAGGENARLPGDDDGGLPRRAAPDGLDQLAQQLQRSGR